MGNLQLTSSAFSPGGEIPRKCGYKNGNEPLPLGIYEIPDEAKSLALIMDDPDAMGAVGKVWVHLVVWHIIPYENEYASGTRHDEIENLFMDRSEGFSLKGKPPFVSVRLEFSCAEIRPSERPLIWRKSCSISALIK